VGPRAGLDTEVRGITFLPLPGIEVLSPGRPARSQTLLTEIPRSTIIRVNSDYILKQRTGSVNIIKRRFGFKKVNCKQVLFNNA
jgi:hypothetical protein